MFPVRIGVWRLILTIPSIPAFRLDRNGENDVLKRGLCMISDPADMRRGLVDKVLDEFKGLNCECHHVGCSVSSKAGVQVNGPGVIFAHDRQSNVPAAGRVTS